MTMLKESLQIVPRQPRYLKLPEKTVALCGPLWRARKTGQCLWPKFASDEIDYAGSANPRRYLPTLNTYSPTCENLAPRELN
jgi:hypothetical protein